MESLPYRVQDKQKEKETVDLDSTSQSHIYRALKRAETDYGLYDQRRHSSNRCERTVEVERNRSQTAAVASPRFSFYDYVSLIENSRAVTCKEIKSSVSRSRRWAGCEGSSKRPRPASKKACEKSKRDSGQQKHSAAEQMYHQTVCNILASQDSKSSYSHVAKMLTRAVPGTSKTTEQEKNRTNRSTAKEILPILPASNPRSSLPLEKGKQLDITLPSVIANDPENSDFRSQNEPYNFGCKSPSSLCLEQEFIGYNINKRHNAFSSKDLEPFNNNQSSLDESRKINAQNSLNKVTTPVKKQAHRAIAGCYDRHQERQRDNQKVVIIHLPNPSIALGSDEKRKQIPKLLLRKSSDSLFDTNKPSKLLREGLGCSTSVSRINLKPFLTNTQWSKTTKT